MLELNPLNHPICFAIPKRLTPFSAWLEHIPFAMFLVDLLRPKTIVELGTQYGDSYCAFCQAVTELKLDTCCYAIDTWQGDLQTGFYGPEVLADLRKHHDPLYGSFSRLIQSIFDEALKHFADGTIDILHIDGYHTYESVKHDCESWLPKMSTCGVVLFHDINVREGDFGIRKFWDETKARYPHFEFLHCHGLGVLAVGEVNSKELQALLQVTGKDAATIRNLFFQIGHQLTMKVADEAKDGELENQKRKLVEKSSQISELGNAIQAKDSQIGELSSALQAKDFQIQQIQHSIYMQILNKYQRVVEKLLPLGKRRRYYYELGLTGIRVILNEGGQSFFRKVKIWLRLSRATTRGHIRRLPKFKVSVSRKEAEKLAFPEASTKPELSIIIPVYNKWQYTVNCLKSICENTEADYEVIVIDDASSDETAEILSEVKNLRLVSNEQNAGFIESCNRGAKASRSKYLLFLNNDTMVTKNWLPPLLEVIRKEDVGAVGSKLIFPDGTLQEAGSIVWNDGSALGYGRGDDPDRPEYDYVREVDYCSGACLLVKRRLFEKIGGLDERFKPGYYEDSDLCLSLKNLGYKVMYQPMSVIGHFEGVTCGTDISSGIKKYQEVNKPKFVEKWNAVLQKYHHYPIPENIILARNKLLGKRVLVIDDRIPTPSQGSGYPRAHSMLKFIGEFGYQVTLFPLDNTEPWQPYTNEFQQLGIEVFYGQNLNFMKFAEDRAGYYDLILVSRPHNMKKAFHTIKRFFPSAALLYDAEAMFSLREILKARVKGDDRREKDAEFMMNEEINLVNKADLIITVSENEKAIILEKTQLDNVTVWGHALEVKQPKTPFAERKDILFVGGFLALDSPNEDAILYFANEVFPKVEELSCRLFIVGMNPPDSVKKLSSSSINVTGYVADLREYYEKCRIFVVPHRYSAGIPWKLQEAMSYGIPCVVSELTASQLDLTDGKEVLVARNTEDFIRKTIKLYQDEELWHQIQKNSMNYVRETCNPETIKNILGQILTRESVSQDKSLGVSRKISTKLV